MMGVRFTVFTLRTNDVPMVIIRRLHCVLGVTTRRPYYVPMAFSRYYRASSASIRGSHGNPTVSWVRILWRPYCVLTKYYIALWLLF